MQPNKHIVKLFIVYSRQDAAHFTKMQQIIASARQTLFKNGISLILTFAAPTEEIHQWQHASESVLKKADIVLLLVSHSLLSVDIALLQKTLASRTPTNVLLAAAAPQDFNWQQTGFYKWCSQYFGVYMLQDLPPNNHNACNHFEQSLLDLVELSVGIQQEKQYHHLLQDGNNLLKQKKWLLAGKKFSHALKYGPEKRTDHNPLQIHEKIEICRQELHFDQLVKLGKMAYQQQNYPDAYQYFERALHIKPDPQIIILRENSLRTPIPAYKILKQLSEKDWFYECLQEGERLFKLQKWDAAHEQYEQAAAIHHFGFNYNLSNIYRRMKECRMHHCFEEVFNLGREAYKAKKHHEALDFFEEACNIKPDDPTAIRVRNKCRRIVKLKNLLPYALHILGWCIIATILIYFSRYL